MYLSEGISDTLIVYLLLKKLVKPFKEWDAYKVGIIDENGNKLKDPKTAEEKKAWTLLDVLIWKIKKLMMKFVGKSKLAAMLTAAYLLKDSYTLMILTNKKLLKESEDINVKTKDVYLLKQTLNLCPKIKETIILNSSINEEEILPLFLKQFTKIYNALTKNNINEEEMLSEMLTTMVTMGPMDTGTWTITTDDVFDPKYIPSDPYIDQWGKDPKKSQQDQIKYDKAHKPEFNTKFLDKWREYAAKQAVFTEPDRKFTDYKFVDSTLWSDEIKDDLPVFYVDEGDFKALKSKKYNLIKNVDVVNMINRQKDFYVKYNDTYYKISF